jgi:deoxyribonuclease V
VVVLDATELRTVEMATSEREVTFPYVPGLLTFREAPVLVPAFEQLQVDPDVVLVDGHGLAHPRGFGLASHLGLLLDKPTIGCAKKPLVGDFPPVGEERGEWQPVQYGGRRVGAVVRTKRNVKPVFVSIGYRIDLEGAVDVVLRTSRGYRLPEPLRQAHLLVSKTRRLKAESSQTEAI